MSWSARLAVSSIVALAWTACGGDAVVLPDYVAAACTDTCIPGLVCHDGFCFVDASGIDAICRVDADCFGPGTTCDTRSGFCIEGGAHCAGKADCTSEETCVHGLCFLGVADVDGGAG